MKFSRPQLEASRGLSAAKPRIRLALLLLCLLVLPACETPPQQADENLPPVHPEPLERYLPPPESDLPAAQATVYIQQVLVPLDLPADLLWERVDEAAFPQVTRSVWNANGLRVGVIGRDDLPAAIRLLPPAISNQQRKLIASAHLTSIRRSPPLRSTFTVDLTIPPRAVSEEHITGGRAQMLLSVDADHTLSLTPHHYLPQPAIVEQIEEIRRERLDLPQQAPSTILDKELDGRVYRELAVAVGMSRGKALVVGLYRPWPMQPAPEPTDRPGVTPPNPFDRFDLTQPPPLADDDLGRALFTGVTGGKPVQFLLLITLDPLGAPTVQP